MKILVTGATGFIGSRFIRLALSRGHQIIGLTSSERAIPSHLPPDEYLTWLRGTLGGVSLREIESSPPDVCLHTAWITTPGVYLESPENERFLESSLRFFRRVRELGTGHIFGLGTCIEYKIGDGVLSEDRTPAEPKTLYARCKNQLRLAMEAEASANNFLFSWGRVFYPYGLGEHPSRLCSSIIQRLARNEEILLKTPTATKDYIYIDDLAGALMAVIENRCGGVINLGTGVGVSVREIAQTLGQMTGKAELIREASPPEPDPLGDIIADASKLRSLGWGTHYTLKQGLKELLTAHGLFPYIPPDDPSGRLGSK